MSVDIALADSLVYTLARERDRQLWVTNAAIAYQRAIRRGETGAAEHKVLSERSAIVKAGRERDGYGAVLLPTNERGEP